MAAQTPTQRKATAKKAAATRKRNASKRQASTTRASARNPRESAQGTARRARRTAQTRVEAEATRAESLALQAERARALRACLRGRRGRAARRRACLRRHGRTPGRVTTLSAKATGKRRIVLRFRAPGSDGADPPAARTYLIKQSRRPIRNARAFRRARALCRGTCRFSVTELGAKVSLKVTGLRRRRTYHYAVAARDNVSARLGRRSRSVKARTR